MMRGSYPIGVARVVAGEERAVLPSLYLCRVHDATTLLTPIAPPLKALVAQAARLPQPRDRTIVLACWMVARLAVPRLPRESDFSDADALQQRAEATRRWLMTQGLPAAVSLSASRACDVAAEPESSLLADALEVLRDASDGVLDNSARAELTTLAQLLRRSSLAAMR